MPQPRSVGLQVEMANEKLSNVWRLREMQLLLAGLQKLFAAMLMIQDIFDVLNPQRPTRCAELIAESIADLACDLIVPRRSRFPMCWRG